MDELLRRLRWPVLRRLAVHPSGDERSRSRSCGVDSGGATGTAAGAAPADAAGAAVGGTAMGGVAAEADVTGGAADVAALAGPMIATTLLTGTVSPSLTRISDTTPAAGDGISASTLSVEISKSGSSRAT